jgi:low affinity Fe/Cu permease
MKRLKRPKNSFTRWTKKWTRKVVAWNRIIVSIIQVLFVKLPRITSLSSNISITVRIVTYIQILQLTRVTRKNFILDDLIDVFFFAGDSGSVQEVAVNSENNGADDSSEEEPQTTTQLESEFAPAQTPAKKLEAVAPQSDSKKNPSPAKAQDTPKQQTSAQPKHKPLAGTKKNAGIKPKLTFTPKAKK